MKNNWKMTSIAVAAALGSMVTSVSVAQDTIKVGILHSLSGTMAISETTLKDTMLMLIEEQNAAGGLLGKQLEAVVDLLRRVPAPRRLGAERDQGFD